MSPSGFSIASCLERPARGWILSWDSSSIALGAGLAGTGAGFDPALAGPATAAAAAAHERDHPCGFHCGPRTSANATIVSVRHALEIADEHAIRLLARPALGGDVDLVAQIVELGIEHALRSSDQ